MLLPTVIQSLVVTLLAIMTTAAPTSLDGPVQRQAGPSGYVIYPPGGTTWQSGSLSYNVPLGGGTVGQLGTVEVIYQGVSQDFTRETAYHFTTAGIDISVMAPDFSGSRYYVQRGVAPVNGNLTISASILLEYVDQWPVDPNTSEFRLVIDEYQFVSESEGYDSMVAFQAAAPLLTMVYNMLP